MTCSIKGLILCFFILAISENTLSQKRLEMRATVGGFKSDSVSKFRIIGSAGMSGRFKVTDDHWEAARVDSFSVMILRDTAIIFRFRNVGMLFQKELKSAFQSLIPQDRVLFYRIYATDPYLRNRLLDPLEYVIQ
jgi:hypothetical protein